MPQRMNRQYRREQERLERRRQKRADRAQSRRRRRVEQTRSTARLDLKQWLRTPYKPADLFAVFLLLWGLRYAALLWLGTEPDGAAQPSNLVAVGLIIQAVFALAMAAYIRYFAREDLHWLGPADGQQMPPIQAVGTGLLIGAIAWGGSHILTILWQFVRPWLPDSLPGAAEGPQLLIPGALPASQDLVGSGAEIWVAALLLLVVKALADELFYRRILIRLLERVGLSQRSVILFSTFLFAVSIGTTNYILSSTLAGAAFALFYTRTRATLVPVTGHLAWALLRFLSG